MTFKIEAMIEMDRREEFVLLHPTFDTEEAAQKWMNEALAVGWIWPHNAVIWKIEE